MAVAMRCQSAKIGLESRRNALTLVAMAVQWSLRLRLLAAFGSGKGLRRRMRICNPYTWKHLSGHDASAWTEGSSVEGWKCSSVESWGEQGEGSRSNEGLPITRAKERVE